MPDIDRLLKTGERGGDVARSLAQTEESLAELIGDFIMVWQIFTGETEEAGMDGGLISQGTSEVKTRRLWVNGGRQLSAKREEERRALAERRTSLRSRLPAALQPKCLFVLKRSTNNHSARQEREGFQPGRDLINKISLGLTKLTIKQYSAGPWERREVGAIKARGRCGGGSLSSCRE